MAESKPAKTDLIMIEGDHGVVTCNPQGMPVLYRLACDQYGQPDREYLEITRFDLQGYFLRFPEFSREETTIIDIIQVGFWTADFEYVEPCSIDYRAAKFEALKPRFGEEVARSMAGGPKHIMDELFDRPQ